MGILTLVKWRPLQDKHTGAESLTYYLIFVGHRNLSDQN